MRCNDGLEYTTLREPRHIRPEGKANANRD